MIRFLFCIFIYQADVYFVTAEEHHNETIILNEGETLQLECNLAVNAVVQGFVIKTEPKVHISAMLTDSEENSSCKVNAKEEKDLKRDPRYNVSCDPNYGILSLYLNNVSRKDNGVVFKCQASKMVNETTLFVQAPLKHIEISPKGPLLIQDGEEVEINCTTSPTMPKAIIKWHLSGNRKSVYFHDVRREFWKGENNLTISHSTIRYKGNPKDNDKAIICTAENGNGAISNNLTLNVVYGPKIVSSNVESNVLNLAEGEKSKTIVCSADCNPDCSFLWIDNNGNQTYAASLDLGRVDLSTKGSYTCFAENLYGTKNETVTVTVQYIRMNISTEAVSYSRGEDITISCSAFGFPEDIRFWQWNHHIRANLIRRLKGEDMTFRSELKIKNCSYKDFGNYTCQASNTDKTNKTSTIQIEIRDQPVIGKTESNTLSHDRNSSASTNITTYIYSVPPVQHINWFKNDVLLKNSTDYMQMEAKTTFEIEVYGKLIPVAGIKASLLIQRHQIDTNDTYKVRVENEIGGNEKEFFLSNPDANLDISNPDANLDKDNNTSSITVVVIVVMAIIVILFIVLGILGYWKWKRVQTKDKLNRLIERHEATRMAAFEDPVCSAINEDMIEKERQQPCGSNAEKQNSNQISIPFEYAAQTYYTDDENGEDEDDGDDGDAIGLVNGIQKGTEGKDQNDDLHESSSTVTTKM